jgi:hypothetical protein
MLLSGATSKSASSERVLDQNNRSPVAQPSVEGDGEDEMHHEYDDVRTHLDNLPSSHHTSNTQSSSHPNNRFFAVVGCSEVEPHSRKQSLDMLTTHARQQSLSHRSNSSASKYSKPIQIAKSSRGASAEEVHAHEHGGSLNASHTQDEFTEPELTSADVCEKVEDEEHTKILMRREFQAICEHARRAKC